MTENQDLLAKIGQLAGQINKHKNQRRPTQNPPSTYNARHPRAGWAPYRAGGPQRYQTTHRNRTLILNKKSAVSSDTPKRASINATPPHFATAQITNRKLGKIRKRDELCKRFTRTGSCYKGPKCPYTHDANKVAICKDFLQTGKCRSGDNCDLSHDPSPHRSPVCVHFLRGRCSNPECRYTHVRVTPGAPVCRAFAILGYCEKGEDCTDRHVYECPDYANTGTCKKSKCSLPHVDRAGQIRKTTATKSDTTPDEEEDISSDEKEHDEIDSDDIDSDELDTDEDEPMVEFVEGGTGDKDLSGQQDFVHF